jgi:hypothetical protein
LDVIAHWWHRESTSRRDGCYELNLGEAPLAIGIKNGSPHPGSAIWASVPSGVWITVRRVLLGSLWLSCSPPRKGLEPETGWLTGALNFR